MDIFLPGFIMGFREGLEAFLVVAVIIQYLNKIGMERLRKNAFYGVLTGGIASLLFGGVLYLITNAFGKMDETAKLWESVASLIALVLISTFIYWMIKHGRNMTTEIQGKVSQNLSALGVFVITMVMVLREGAEIAIFTFAGKYTVVSISLGILLALIFTILVFYSLVKVNIKTIFNVTLAYLILQAGFLLGYGIHEGLSALKSLDYLNGESFLFVKAFDLSNTMLNHKEGILGLPLYVVFGWYSKPEWVQFISQYLYTLSMFFIWHKMVNEEITN